MPALLRKRMLQKYAAALLLLAALGSSGCLAPQTPAARATDAARELNLAARFGRMDVAIGHTASGARGQFLERRTAWGKELRVLDVELAGLSMSDPRQATVLVDVAWTRMSEGSLRSTRIAQTWRDDEGWQLVREQRIAGDIGLFGEQVVLHHPEARDAHFPSKTIR
ncbi:MAG TPA: hypothetical protein VK524_08670 [Polyangiaceae bacterium]|nr:hypothetical protein [Polyangiaceae bacterium]